jgi:23S rRNA (adenine2503-C2)-methyltransferase
MENILDLSLDELKGWMKLHNESGFRAKQVMDFIYNEVWDFTHMNNIPIALKEKLKKSFYIGIPEIINLQVSKLNETSKFLYEFNDGSLIETVSMKYDYGNSICVSTQVGCRMGCTFCASTIGGMVRNLTSGEILAQILRTQKEIGERISNVVLMGSGEPFDNYENVLKFLQEVTSDYGLNIGQRHITLSTCGIVPRILELAEKNMQITLAISLHAPNDELRKTMMPIANRYTIKETLEACRYYINKTNRRITFEYALVRNINDTEAHAIELCSKLKGLLCHVNLIPVNEVKENNFKKSYDQSVKSFSYILTSYGIDNTIRREMGADIEAACGQLRRNYLNSNQDLKGV